MAGAMNGLAFTIAHIGNERLNNRHRKHEWSSNDHSPHTTA